jgi:hypothetical protein
MAQQEIRGRQVKDFDLTNSDIAPDAAISETKIDFPSVGGHDHDLKGTPTPAVLIARQLRPTPSTIPDLRVQIAACNGVNFPSGVTPAVPAQSVNFVSILPLPSLQRIDVVYLDQAGLVQVKLGTAVVSGPVPPAHDGVMPIAEIGPLTSSTTAITTSLIKDVRPFLAANTLINLRSSGAFVGYVHAIDLAANLSTSVNNGVATVNAAGAGGSAVDASSTVKGVARINIDPLFGVDPVALSALDPRLTLASNSIQKDGSVAFTGTQSFGGNSITNVGGITATGPLIFTSSATIQTLGGGNLTLAPSANGKVIIDSAAAVKLPNISGTPPNPSVGDIWYSVDNDEMQVRTISGPKSISATQTGVLGLALTEVSGDNALPPTQGNIGDTQTVDFPKNVVTDSAINFTFQVPEDAVLLDDINVRLNYCMSSAAAGNVRFNYTYTATPINGTLPGTPTGTLDFSITPSASAGVFQRDETIVIPANSLTPRSTLTFKLRRKSSDGADTHSGAFKLVSLVVLYAKKDIASQRNVINVFDEVTDLGQVDTIKFTGNLVSASANVAGTAVVTFNDPSFVNASDTVIGNTRLNIAPAVPSDPVALGANSPVLPTQSQKDALSGTSGTPSGSNRYVTDTDPRFATITPAIQAALGGTSGSPSGSNKYVTDQDPRIPTQLENDALVGFGTGGPSSTNKYVLQDSTAILTTDQQGAVVGSSGTPSSSNKFVTEADTRILTANQQAALAGTVGTPSGSNKFVTQTDPATLTAAQQGAVAGTSGTPSGSNRFVTQQDPGVMIASVQAAVAGTSGTPSGSNRFVTENDATYVITNGTRAFTGQISGIDPSLGTHLATKAYADALFASFSSTFSGDYGPAVQDLPALRAVPPANRQDKQIRVVEDTGTIYRFDLEASGGGEPPNAGPGQWFKISSATQNHNLLSGLQGGNGSTEFYHFTAAQHGALTTGGATALHTHSHASLTGLGVDDHTQYIRVDGTRAFTGVQSGVTPTLSAHLTTKGYVDGAITAATPDASTTVKGLTKLTTPPLVAVNPIAVSGSDPRMLVATDSQDGLFSSQATIKLDSIEVGAQVNWATGTGLQVISDTLSVKYGDIAGTAVEGSNTRVPTQPENDALQGTDGAPSNSNRYVTNSDPRNTNSRTPNAHAATHAPDGTDPLALGTPVAIGLANAAGTAVNYVRSDHVHQHPVFSANDLHTEYSKSDGTRAFTGTVAGVTPTAAAHLTTKSYVDGIAPTLLHNNLSGLQGGTTAEYYHATAAQNAALAGTSGTPSGSNRYVTDADARNTNARTPTAHASSHQNGGSDEISVTGLSGQLADIQKVAVQDEGVAIASIDTINFIGVPVTVVQNGSKVDVTISGTGGGAGGGDYDLLYTNIVNSSTVSSTSAETTFNQTGNITGGTLTLGSILKITAAGKISTLASPAQTVTWRVKYGSTTLATHTGSINSTNAEWKIEFEGTVRATGVSGSLSVDSALYLDGNLSQSATGSSVSIDTTTTSAGGASIQFGTSSASNSSFLENLSIAHLKPAAASSTDYRLRYTNTADSNTVSNTAAETTFDKNFDLTAGILDVGNMLGVYASGKLNTLATAQTVTFRVYYGAVVLATHVETVTATNSEWRVRLEGIVRAAGASGSIQVDSVAELDAALQESVVGGSSTIDTVSLNNIHVTVQFGTASTSNTAVLEDIQIFTLHASSSAIPDASTSIKGVSRLTTAPAVATDPLVVSDTDPRNTNARTPTSHASTHLPSGSDPITTAAAVDIGTSNTAGAANSLSRSDHVHNHPVFASGDLHTQYVKADGTRAFTAVVSGITPTATAHLATKGYVDSLTGSVDTGGLGAHVYLRQSALLEGLSGGGSGLAIHRIRAKAFTVYASTGSKTLLSIDTQAALYYPAGWGQSVIGAGFTDGTVSTTPGSWAYCYVIWGSSPGTSAIWSNSSTSPTLPSGYTHYGLASVDIVQSFNVPGDTDSYWIVEGYVRQGNTVFKQSYATELSAGQATSATNVTLTRVPPVARAALIKASLVHQSASQVVEFNFVDDDVGTINTITSNATATELLEQFIELPSSESQILRYRWTGTAPTGGNGLTLRTRGFVM